MHLNKTGPRFNAFEEAFITDLRSFRAVVALLKVKHPTLFGVHIAPAVLAKIWLEAPHADIKLQYQVSLDACNILIDGTRVANTNGEYLWDNMFLGNIGSRQLP